MPFVMLALFYQNNDIDINDIEYPSVGFSDDKCQLSVRESISNI